MYSYPRPRVDIAEESAASHAGAEPLTGTIPTAGFAGALCEALGPWTRLLAGDHGAKALLDLAMTLAIGEEVTSDTDLQQCEPGVFGAVASAPSISRTLTGLAGAAPSAIHATSKARGVARERAWTLAGNQSLAAGASTKNPLVIDRDAPSQMFASRRSRPPPRSRRSSATTRCARSSTTAAKGPGAVGDPAAARQRRLQHGR